MANNIRLVAWVDNANRYSYQLFDATTGSSVTGIRASNTNTLGIKTIAIGDYLVTIFSQSGTVTARAIDSTDPTYTPIADVTAISATVSSFDVCLLDDKLYLAAYTSGGALVITIINQDISIGITRTIASTDCTFGLTIAADQVLNELWIAYVPTGSADAKYLVIDQTLTTVLTSTTFAATTAVLRVECPTLYVSNGSATIFYTVATELTSGDSCEGFLYTNHTYKITATRAGSVGTVFDLKNSVSLISKPFLYTLNGTSILCVLVGYFGHSQGYAFVLNESGFVLAKIGLDGIAAGYVYNSYNHTINTTASTQGSLPEVTALSATEITIPILQETALGSSSSAASGFVYSNGINIVSLNFNDSNALQFVETANETHITGGFLGHYDGETFSEGPFLTIPEPPQRITSTGAGSNFPAGTYQWVLVFEWFDAQNNLHQSAVSEPTVKVFGAGVDSVNMTINPNYLSFSPKADRTYLSVYGTETNGSVFYRLTAVPTNISSAVSDNYNSGAGRSGFPQLYTTGGELDNDPVPACSAIFKYRNRVFLVPSETPNTLWYSKTELQSIPGTPIEFSAVLQYQVNTSNGNTVTGVQIDDKCVLFKPTSLFYFVGDGPNSTGTGSDFSPATQIPSAVGSNEPKSVIGYQGGAIFKSLQGWYLIDRALNVSYIGADVEDYNADAVVSSTQVPNSTEIRIILDSGVAIVYDWLLQKWKVHTNQAAVCAAIYDGAYTRLLADGTLLQEDESFSDNGQYIPMKLQTSWLSFAGLQSFQRVYKLILLGDYISAHGLRVSIQYDFNPNTLQTVEFTPSSYLSFPTYGSGSPYGTGSPDDVYGDLSFANYPSYQWRIFTTLQKCQAIQITIEEIQTDGVIGEGFSLSGLVFEVGVEGGVMRLPAVKSFG